VTARGRKHLNGERAGWLEFFTVLNRVTGFSKT
jgi:hypothetical protein